MAQIQSVVFAPKIAAVVAERLKSPRRREMTLSCSYLLPLPLPRKICKAIAESMKHEIAETGLASPGVTKVLREPKDIAALDEIKLEVTQEESGSRQVSNNSSRSGGLGIGIGMDDPTPRINEASPGKGTSSPRGQRENGVSTIEYDPNAEAPEPEEDTYFRGCFSLRMTQKPSVKILTKTGEARI